MPRVVALLDVLFVLLQYLILGCDFDCRQDPVQLSKSRFLSECRGSRRVEITVHHGPEDECGRSRRRQRCEEADHWHLSAGGVPVPDARALARLLMGGRRRVLLRADAGAPYGVVQGALSACAEAGIRFVPISATRQPNP